MKKHFRALTAALLSLILFSSVPATASAAVAEASELTDTAPQTESVMGAAPSAEKVGTLPTLGYEEMIYSLEDYILALKRTYINNDELKQALAAAERNDSYVDNSKLKYFPKIGDQGSIGSCVAWSCIYYQFTHEVNKALDRAATDETTFQPMFLYNIYNGCNQARHIENLLFSTGCAPVSMVRDTQNDKNWNTEYDIWREATNYRICNYLSFPVIGEKGIYVSSVDDPDIAAMKAALRAGDILSFPGPIAEYKKEKVVAAPGVDESIVGEEIVVKTLGTGIANHMMTVVGYNDNIWVDHNKNGKVDQGELGAFKIANQYGEKRHSNGFFWVSYDAMNEKSMVEGVVSESNRRRTIGGCGRFVVSKDYGTSRIYLKYTLNSDNRADGYAEITAVNNTNGTKYVRQINPYQYSDYQRASNQKLNYKGETGFCDGAMLTDLNTIIPDINSDNFNDYTWSVRFVDRGVDKTALTVKEAMIVDENNGKTYELDTQFPFQLNGSDKTVFFKNYYHFSKLYVPDASTLVVDSELKFTFKTANETDGTTPIKYAMVIAKDGKQVFSKLHKAIAVDKAKGSSVIKGTWKPTQTGNYTITIIGTDASGVTATRSAAFHVYNKQLAVRAINIDKGKYIDQYDTIKMTPFVTGGTAPYTYSYYYIKGGKTVTIVENTKNSTKSKKFNYKTGKYTLLVKVKDAKGTVAQATQCVSVTPSRVVNFVYNKQDGKVGDSIYIRSDINYLPEGIKSNEYIYTVEKDGKTEELKYSDPKWPDQVVWKPTQSGMYKITCTVKVGSNVVTTGSTTYEVGGTQVAGMRQINVNVITYVCNSTNPNNYYIHYWGGKSGTGDVKCTALNTTTTRNVGFWSSAQTFKQFTANIPEDATGFKFHIGDRWFGTDGSTATQNTVYAFNYDYDRCVYTKQ